MTKKNLRNNLTKKQKGAIAVAKVSSDLIIKGWGVFVPINDIHRYDLLVEKDKKILRIQVKYSGDGFIADGTCYHSKDGSKKIKYQDDDFDYYGLYLPDIDQVVYPSIKFRGRTIRSILPDSPVKFNWWEDFVEFTDSVEKRSISEWGIAPSTDKYLNIYNKTKIDWPSKEELQKLLWELPTSSLAKQLGVSDKAIEKRSKKFGLTKPPRGYWSKLKVGKLVT